MRTLNAQSSAQKFAYRLFGHRLQTHERLPVLPVDEDTRFDDMVIELAEGEVPLNLVNPIRSGVCFQATDRQILMTIPGVVRFLIEDGQNITYECIKELTRRELLLFILDNAVIALFYQKGCLPVRGSAVISPNGKLLILQGATANGKTTLAWLLSHEGYRFVSDGCCMIRISSENEAFMYPGIPFFRIVSADQRKLRIDSGEGWLLRKDLFLKGISLDPVKEAIPVDQMVYLNGTYSVHTTISKNSGRQKVKQINASMLLPNYWGLWQQSRSFMDSLFTFYNRVDVYELNLTRGDQAHHEALKLIVNLNECKHE